MHALKTATLLSEEKACGVRRVGTRERVWMLLYGFLLAPHTHYSQVPPQVKTEIWTIHRSVESGIDMPPGLFYFILLKASVYQWFYQN